jgi:predicted CXXCH cytochrome family protein
MKQVRRRRWPLILVAVFVGLILVSGVGFVAASALEEHDSFCIACHTVPETTYYNRAYMALDNPNQPVIDLATAHYHLAQSKNSAAFACISCHRGDSSAGDRISTLALGGRDALIYVVGKENPAIEKTHIQESWLPNAACVSCHQDTLLTLKGLDNHFHNYLPQAAEALAKGGKLQVPDTLSSRRDILLGQGLRTISNTTLVCTDCHAAHKSASVGAQLFMDHAELAQACVSCHKAAKQGPQDPNGL